MSATEWVLRRILYLRESGNVEQLHIDVDAGHLPKESLSRDEQMEHEARKLGKLVVMRRASV